MAKRNTVFLPQGCLNVSKIEGLRMLRRTAAQNFCRPASPVFTPAALKAAGNKPNESNQSDYSETGRTENP